MDEQMSKTVAAWKYACLLIVTIIGSQGFAEECCENDCGPYYGYDCGGAYPDNDCVYGHEAGLCGIWMPECPPLFRPLIADPRQITYSVGWRFNDQAITKNNIDVSYYDSFAVYRWFNVGCFHGDLQLDIEGCLWALFDPMTFSAPLINADYYVGFPLTYAFGPWSFRLRGYHISCHIGDEFLLNHPGFDRRNPSAEFIDFFVSNQITDDIRLYGGVGYVLECDDSFDTSRYYLAVGTELRLYEIGFVNCRDRLYGAPIFGMHFRWCPDFKNHIDATYVLGYEWGKMSGLQRRLRLFIEYHDGYSAEGQFCRIPTSYFSTRISYGF